ncbi:MAG: hypothetical protein HOP16_21585 [Acidobacteria bacterium]|nr:hypothetical protein [Acidobacteriota bacterium]
MNTPRVVAIASALVLWLSVAAFAHEGHPHRFMGTLSAVTGTQLEVKTTDGKTVVFALDGKSVIQQGRAKAELKDLKVGERIVVSALEVPAGKTMTAINVQLRVPAAAKQVAQAPASK